MGLPVVNFDSIARQLHAKEKGLQLYSEDPLDVAVTSNRFSRTRILDRFLVSEAHFLPRVTVKSSQFLQYSIEQGVFSFTSDLPAIPAHALLL